MLYLDFRNCGQIWWVEGSCVTPMEKKLPLKRLPLNCTNISFIPISLKVSLSIFSIINCIFCKHFQRGKSSSILTILMVPMKVDKSHLTIKINITKYSVVCKNSNWVIGITSCLFEWIRFTFFANGTAWLQMKFGATQLKPFISNIFHEENEAFCYSRIAGDNMVKWEGTSKYQSRFAHLPGWLGSSNSLSHPVESVGQSFHQLVGLWWELINRGALGP